MSGTALCGEVPYTAVTMLPTLTPNDGNGLSQMHFLDADDLLRVHHLLRC